MAHYDTHPDVLAWQSEEVVIGYRDPADGPTGKIRRYFPDFVVKYKDKDGKIQVQMIEVKPLAQTKPPNRPKTKKGQARYISEVATYIKNEAKWKAAKSFCAARGWTFQVMTEKQIYGR